MRAVLDITAAALIFLAIVMLMAAAGMMDKGAEILTCLKLLTGSTLAFIAGAGFRRI